MRRRVLTLLWLLASADARRLLPRAATHGARTDAARTLSTAQLLVGSGARRVLEVTPRPRVWWRRLWLLPTFRRGGVIAGGGPGAACVLHLDRHLDRKDWGSAALLVARDVDWKTPAWHAHGAVQLKSIWESGVDDRWKVRPQWRPVHKTFSEGGQLVLERECVPFRIMMVNIRLTQTFHVAKQGPRWVVRKCLIRRH